MKKSLQIILAICVIMVTPLSTWAEVNNEAVYEVTTNDIPGWPIGPEILADTGVLMETETGEVLYDKGMNEERYPASITKVMTALLAVENSSPNDKVEFTLSALKGMHEGTNIGMIEGEVLTMEQCLKALIIRSANEVANQIAEHVGGTQEEFIDMMNKRAIEIGCKNTNFNNASGMPDEEHYTTAYDMALIFREALKNEDFRSLFDTVDFTIEPTNKNPEERYLHSNHHLFVSTVPQHYPGVVAGKTGNTGVAGSTLVTAVERDGIDFIAVVMRTGDHLYCCEDTRKLFDYGYNEFEKINAEEGALLAPRGSAEMDFEISEKEVAGNKVEKEYSYQGYFLGTMEVDRPAVTEGIMPVEGVPREEVQGEEEIVTKPPVVQGNTQSNATARIAIIALAVLVLAGLGLIIMMVMKNKKKNQ